MKIYLISDAHVEFHKDYHGPAEEVDVIVLGGDIHIGCKSVEIAAWYQKRYRVPVILVAGNHEFYGSEIDDMLDALRRSARGIDQVYFLENDAVEIRGTRFLGCTLWSDFTINGSDKVEVAQHEAAQCISDFEVIYRGGAPFTPQDAAERFRRSYAWLRHELARPYDGDSIVITHFAPHREAIHPDYVAKGTDQLTPYFTSDCAPLMQRFPIKAWFYGHTHNSIDTIVENGTRLVSNQRGYPSERWNYTKYQSIKVIEI